MLTLHGEQLKTFPYVVDYNSGSSRAIVTLFVPVKTGIYTL